MWLNNNGKGYEKIVCACVRVYIWRKGKVKGKKGKDNSWQAHAESGSLCVMDRFQNGATATENSIKAPQKTKNRTTTWFINATSGYKFKGS